jgi:FixJ family two-component response regulator
LLSGSPSANWRSCSNSCAAGRTRRSKDLGISVKTVGHHVQNIYRKAGVHSRAAATRWAFEHDLV